MGEYYPIFLSLFQKKNWIIHIIGPLENIKSFYYIDKIFEKPDFIFMTGNNSSFVLRLSENGQLVKD